MVSCIPLKASQARLKVGPYSIFMKLALCEIGFCLMDPCMVALPDTSTSAFWHQSHTEDGATEQGKGQKKPILQPKKGHNDLFKQNKNTCMSRSTITENWQILHSTTLLFIFQQIKGRYKPPTVGLCARKFASFKTLTYITTQVVKQKIRIIGDIWCKGVILTLKSPRCHCLAITPENQSAG